MWRSRQLSVGPCLEWSEEGRLLVDLFSGISRLVLGVARVLALGWGRHRLKVGTRVAPGGSTLRDVCLTSLTLVLTLVYNFTCIRWDQGPGHGPAGEPEVSE